MNNIGPYFNTSLFTSVTLHPRQMKNDIYKHLKNNLVEKLQGKCYKGYGFVSKIHEIEERTDGYLIKEDPTGSAKYNVRFSCKLCRPLKGSVVVCEVIAINKNVVYLMNGPIYMLVYEGQINSTNFIYDDKRNIWIAYVSNGKGVPVLQGSFVNTKISDIRIEDKSDKIQVFGTLESIATKEESMNVVKSIEGKIDGFIQYDDYMNQENLIQSSNLVDDIHTDTIKDSESEYESESDGDNDSNESSDST
jgi:DNA-directed RNA polymerase subunit E'/Rpb7